MDEGIEDQPHRGAPWVLAHRLIANERGGSGEVWIAAAESVWEKIVRHCEGTFGAIGLEALLSRSLVLARIEYPWLHDVTVAAGFKGLRPAAHSSAGTDPQEGTIALLGHFLSVLESLIGPDLTVRMIQRIWPETELGDVRTGWKDVQG